MWLATTKCAATQPDSVIVYANDRSNVRAESGTTSANAAIAVIALLSRICLNVAVVGNVPGTQIEKTTTMTART